MAAFISKFVFGFFCILVFLSLIDAVKDEFHEEMFIKPLESGHVYNHFQFTTTWDVDLFDGSQCE